MGLDALVGGSKDAGLGSDGVGNASPPVTTEINLVAVGDAGIDPELVLVEEDIDLPDSGVVAIVFVDADKGTLLGVDLGNVSGRLSESRVADDTRTTAPVEL